MVMGLGVYPNLGVIDGFASARLGDRQISVRASNALGDDRLEQRVGPISIEVVEPLSSRTRSHGTPLSPPLTWVSGPVGSTAPVVVGRGTSPGPVLPAMVVVVVDVAGVVVVVVEVVVANVVGVAVVGVTPVPTSGPQPISVSVAAASATLRVVRFMRFVPTRVRCFDRCGGAIFHVMARDANRQAWLGSWAI